MLSGTTSIRKVVEESVCRSAKDYRFTNINVYKIHANTLMSAIKFGEATITPEKINKNIFLNDEKPKLPATTKCQNYLTTKYVGRVPLEFYSNKEKTKMGREFVLLCREGNPHDEYRMFGTEAAIHGVNTNAGDLSKMTGGGDDGQ